MTGLAFPDISPIAFSLFGFDIRWYSLAYLAGFLLGLAYMKKLVDKEQTQPSKRQLEDFISFAVIGVILGGRLGYVFFYHPSYYLSNPLEILQIWQGGMSFHGGALGVLIAMIAYSKLQKIDFFRLADIVAAATPIGLFFGRLANFANGELYGRETNAAWAVRFPLGDYIPRHPSQLYEAMLEGVVLFIVLAFFYKHNKQRTGTTASLFLIGYGSFRFIVEYFREPDPAYNLIFNFISIGQALSLPMLFIGLFIFIYRYNKKI